MSNLSTTTVLIAIPGTQETKEWSLTDARAALARGEIESNQWAWSVADNDWKTVGELPELNADYEAAVAQVHVPVANRAPVRLVQSRGHEVVREESGFSFFKMFLVILALAIAGLVGVNYLMVDQPLRMNLTQTLFPTAQVHGHLGAFCQKDTLVIHVLPTKEIDAEKLADFLVSLAASTPPSPFDAAPFATIGLSSGWTSQVLMSGADWKSLAQMDKASAQEKEDFILAHMIYISGEPLLIVSRKITDPDALAKRRTQAWENLQGTLFPS